MYVVRKIYEQTMPTRWCDIKFAIQLLMSVGCSHVSLCHHKLGHNDRHCCDAGISSREMVRMVQAKGAGYALSKQQELETMQCVAHATGMLLLIVRARRHRCQQCTWQLQCP